MSDETKTPQPGEFWVHRNGLDIAYFIGKAPCGQMVWQCAGDNVEIGDLDWSGWHPEPRCTGFDWVEPPAIDPGEGWELLSVGTVLQDGDEFQSVSGDWLPTANEGRVSLPGWTYRRKIKPSEVWPKYYVCDTWTHHAYIVRSQCKALDVVKKDGTVEPGNRKWDICEANNVTRGAYKEVTKQEAQQRLETYCKPAEVWPKWYVHNDPSRDWCVEQFKEDRCRVHRATGVKDDQLWIEMYNVHVNDGTWLKVTEAEALARVTPIEPVESPDDWVTQDRVPARPGIDQRAYADGTRVTLWEDAKCLDWDKPAMHGTKINNTTLEIRCRRKDLPAKQPATKRVPVRLYFRKDDGVVVQADEMPDDRFTEIHGSFYVEVTE
jgi:hypothetical protein